MCVCVCASVTVCACMRVCVCACASIEVDMNDVRNSRLCVYAEIVCKHIHNDKHRYKNMVVFQASVLKGGENLVYTFGSQC